MNRNVKLILVVCIIVLGGLWLSSQISETKNQKKIEILTYSQFKKMLTKKGQREVGRIYTKTNFKQEAEKNSIFSFFGPDSGFVLEITPHKINGRYLKPGNRIEASEDRERILDRTIPFTVESLPNVISDKLIQSLENNRIAFKFINEESVELILHSDSLFF